MKPKNNPVFNLDFASLYPSAIKNDKLIIKRLKRELRIKKLKRILNENN